MIAALLLAASAPVRIVSNNPCIDAILAEVAAPERIAAISHYSVEPRATSVDLAWARRFATIGDTAEEVVMQRPDLFLTGMPMPVATRRAVERARIRTVTIGIAGSIAESRRQIATIAEAVGNPVGGRRLIARIDAAVAGAPPARIPALIWEGGGLVPGSGTLADEMLSRAGFANVSPRYGLKYWDILPLEPVLMHPPRVILSPGGSARDLVQRHRALARLNGRIVVADFPEAMLFCGGPTIIRAMQRLKRVRTSL